VHIPELTAIGSEWRQHLVSLNVNFQYRDTMRANLYRLNYLLRKMDFGEPPVPRGQRYGQKRGSIAGGMGQIFREAESRGPDGQERSR